MASNLAPGQLIESATGISYNWPANKLNCGNADPGNIGALNDLLRQRIFEARELDAAALEQIEDECI